MEPAAAANAVARGNRSDAGAGRARHGQPDRCRHAHPPRGRGGFCRRRRSSCHGRGRPGQTFPPRRPGTVAPVDLAMAAHGDRLPSLRPAVQRPDDRGSGRGYRPIGRHVQGDGTIARWSSPMTTTSLLAATATSMSRSRRRRPSGRCRRRRPSGGRRRQRHAAGRHGRRSARGRQWRRPARWRPDDDILAGGSGDDHLSAAAATTSSTAGPAPTVLEGGTGNEILVLADIRDAVTELALGPDGGGNDTVVVAEGYGQSLARPCPTPRRGHLRPWPAGSRHVPAWLCRAFASRSIPTSRTSAWRASSITTWSATAATAPSSAMPATTSIFARRRRGRRLGRRRRRLARRRRRRRHALWRRR